MRKNSPREVSELVRLVVMFTHESWDHWVEAKFNRKISPIKIDVYRQNIEGEMLLEDAVTQLQKAIAREKLKDDKNHQSFSYKIVKKTTTSVQENYNE
jgi:hypothetical protein